MSNNKIASMSDIDRLASLGALEDLLLVGNPLYNDYKDRNDLAEYRIEVCGMCGVRGASLSSFQECAQLPTTPVATVAGCARLWLLLPTQAQ